MVQAFDLAVLKLKRPVTAVGGYFNYDCFAHRDMPPGGEAAAAGPGVPLPPPPPPPPPARAIVGLPYDVHSVSAHCSPILAAVRDLQLPYAGKTGDVFQPLTKTWQTVWLSGYAHRWPSD